MNDICIIQNSLKTTYIFRKAYIKHFIESGRKVYIIAPNDCALSKEKLQKLGAEVLAPKISDNGQLSIFGLAVFNWYILRFRLSHRNVSYLVFFVTTFIFSFFSLALFNRCYLLSIEGLGTFFSKRYFAQKVLRFLLKHFTTIRLFCNRDERTRIGQPNDTITNGIGIDLSIFTSHSSPDSNSLTMIYVGRLIEDKGITDAVTILERALALKLKVTLKVIGDHYPNNPTSLTKENIADIKSKFGSHIQFLGFVESIESIYENSDVLLLPSIREGFPVCVMEASASGIPTLTYRVPGCIDAVKDGVNGFITDFKDIDKMVSLIRTLYEKPSLRKKLKESCRDYARNNFDINDKVKLFESEIRKLD